MSTPTTPIVNNTALSARYQESGTMFQFRRPWGRRMGLIGLMGLMRPINPISPISPILLPPGPNVDLLLVFSFFRLPGQGLLDAFDIFLFLTAREQHRAHNRHQDQYRSGFERDHIIREHSVCDVLNRSENLMRVGDVVRA